MTHEYPRRLLDMANVLRDPCDLDLLLFFVRHPRVLLPSESLAKLLGYDMPVIARSLDNLLTAGLLTRRQSAAHAARFYVFTGGTDNEWLAPLIEIASTRHGRRTLLTLLHAGTGVREPENRMNDFESRRAARKAGRWPIEHAPGRVTTGGSTGGGDRDGHDDL